LNKERNHSNELDLIEIARIVLKNRRLIIAIVSVTAIAAVVYSILAPEIWRSEATFYALSEKKLELSGSDSTLGKLARDLLEQNAQNEAMTSVNIMNSRSFSEKVIKRFNLIDYFELSDPDSLSNMDDALKQLSGIVNVDYNEDSFLIFLQVESKSKTMSKEIADFYLSNLENYLQQTSRVRGRRNRVFLENRLSELRSQIDDLNNAISRYKTEKNAVDIEIQSQELLEQYSTLLASKMKLEIELELAKSYYAMDTPMIRDIVSQIDVLQQQILELEQSTDPSINRFRLDLSRIPSLQEGISKLQLELDILLEVQEYIRPQYESAVLEEQKNMPHLEILDMPREAGRRIKPRRAMICIVSTLMAGFFAIFLAICKESIFSQAERIKELKDTLHDS
jgi:uncharacterized protein involved in exopolysaccharide biosynthesis